MILKVEPCTLVFPGPLLHPLSQTSVMSLFMWLHHTACGILIFRPEIEPVLPALEVCDQPLGHKGSPNSHDFKSNSN